jgi:hypothetical protein
VGLGFLALSAAGEVSEATAMIFKELIGGGYKNRREGREGKGREGLERGWVGAG